MVHTELEKAWKALNFGQAFPGLKKAWISLRRLEKFGKWEFSKIKLFPSGILLKLCDSKSHSIKILLSSFLWMHECLCQKWHWSFGLKDWIETNWWIWAIIEDLYINKGRAYGRPCGCCISSLKRPGILVKVAWKRLERAWNFGFTLLYEPCRMN